LVFEIKMDGREWERLNWSGDTRKRIAGNRIFLDTWGWDIYSCKCTTSGIHPVKTNKSLAEFDPGKSYPPITFKNAYPSIPRRKQSIPSLLIPEKISEVPWLLAGGIHAGSGMTYLLN
jgi:hypothetical protein